jgi:hypothetical protein
MSVGTSEEAFGHLLRALYSICRCAERKRTLYVDLCSIAFCLRSLLRHRM